MTWGRSRVVERCGSCRAEIPASAPLCRLRTGRVRCAACAERLLGEGPPATLPEPPPPKPPTPTLDRYPLQPFVARMRQQLGLDVKQRAAGDTDDEPSPEPAPAPRARRRR